MTGPNDFVVHTVSFNRAYWTPTQARRWLKARVETEGWKIKKRVEHTAGFLKYRMFFPDNDSLVKEFTTNMGYVRQGITMTVGEY